GIEVLAISCVTNMAAGILPQKIHHEEVLETGRAVRDKFVRLLKGVIPRMEAADGSLYTGCNIENSSYGLTMCAERVALFKALSEGARSFRRIAVAADTDVLTPPCGPCRQLLWEFCSDARVTLVNLQGVTEDFAVRDLLPRAFDASFL
ncbi:MAG TPA: cytidine deaminase, partial [Bryobacteraceae bacterium]|nr:cytidine deaminase [Bryobacteraceae bacterium]